MIKSATISGVALLTAFWMLDFPPTVRVKVAALKSLPLAPETLNAKIHELCAGAYAGSAVSTCYQSFYSREAYELIAAEKTRKETCKETLRSIETDKEWVKNESPDTEDEGLRVSYIYLGDDETITKKLGAAPQFFPTKCIFVSLSKGISTFK